MRILIAAAVALILSTASLFAETTEGTVKKVDTQAMTVVLDDGNTYKLPAAMDMSVITEGVSLLIAYDVGSDGVNQITDLEVVQ